MRVKSILPLGSSYYLSLYILKFDIVAVRRGAFSCFYVLSCLLSYCFVEGIMSGIVVTSPGKIELTVCFVWYVTCVFLPWSIYCFSWCYW